MSIMLEGPENTKNDLKNENLLNASPIPNPRYCATKNNSAMLGLCIGTMTQQDHRLCIRLDSC